MRISIRVKNETHTPKVEYPNIIEVWNEFDYNPTIFEMHEHSDFNILGKHIKSIVQSYILENSKNCDFENDFENE
jgi:hypothetical protein